MTIQEQVAAKISTSGESVKEIVIESLAQVEINRRVALITSGIQKQDTLEKELKKLDRDDVKTYVGGNPVTAMSDKRFEDVKKAKEGLEKLTKAIDKALADNSADSYNKLSEILK